MATGGWQGLVIGRQVKGWEGAERMEVASGKWERLEGPRMPFSSGGVKEREEMEQRERSGREKEKIEGRGR